MKYLLRTTLFVFTILIIKPVEGQKLQYSFGENSDVEDSVKTIINWYKRNSRQSDLKKLNLFAGIDYCDGHLNLYISQHSGKNADGLTKLAKSSNRFLKIAGVIDLPIIFSTDILTEELEKENSIFIRMTGYYIKVEKNDRYIWKVTQMNLTF